MNRWFGPVICSALVVGAFVVGIAVGASSTPDPVVKIKTVQVPHYIAGPTKIIEHNKLPDVCRNAISRARDVQDAVTKYEGDVGELNSILDQAWRAANSGDVRQVNAVKQRQIKLEGDSIKDLLDLRSAQEDLKSFNPKCEAQVR
jgi:hypothetical protein